MTNLPTSEQSSDLDNINVTRAEFRADIGVFLEFVAQALGGVTGNYTTQPINPAAPILQGTPKLESGATPADDSRDDRIPSTRWVQEHGRYVGSTAPGTPADGMLWVDTSSDPYQLQVYNAGQTDFDVLSGFPSGTRMLFQQPAAPTGWTKVTSGVDNMALRVTTGTPSIVDSNQGFSTVFTDKTVTGSVDPHSLSVSEMPSHSHGITDTGHSHPISDPGHSHPVQSNNATGGNYSGGGNSSNLGPYYNTTTGNSSAGIGIDSSATGISVQNNGSNSGHSHGFSGGTVNLQINYVDVIIASKN